MWLKWLPWRYIIRSVARKHQFLDPIAMVSRLQQFSQPSEVAAPTELLRSGAVMHARGLVNSQAIQHNLDWIWPYWVERQFNPADISFVPRAFSITHINLTHRNWTAVGMPGCHQMPVVDPRGLVMPFHDSWSLDAWVIDDEGGALFPSRMEEASQKIDYEGNLSVTTEMIRGELSLIFKTEVVGAAEQPVCQISVTARSHCTARLVVALRPYNPEGVSFIHDIAGGPDARRWRVNDEYVVSFSEDPQQTSFSDYKRGDVFSHLPAPGGSKGMKAQKVHCEVGMATAAALFMMEPGEQKTITVHIPLKKNPGKQTPDTNEEIAERLWKEEMAGCAQLSIPEEHFQFLYDTALRTLILHSPDDVYPGPYTYKRFWFRDAAFILYAMTCVGFAPRVRRVLDRFPSRQTQFGYFLSQEGEWDSNGEALWIYEQFCRLTNQRPKDEWKDSIYKGGQWIQRKRLRADKPSAHAGLLPPGFSAEHLGPNDYYYWDDFWGVAGLKAAAYLASLYGDDKGTERFTAQACDFERCIKESLAQVEQRLGSPIIPAAPYRRMDAGAIGSVVTDYPLMLNPSGEKSVLATVDFLIDHSCYKGGFFQDMTHSGINPYLTLHMAQVLLRAGDQRYYNLMQSVADLASPTGQWPEAVHPQTGGGCMGDGQHVWAAAEWVMMVRNCFLRCEEPRRLILCSGIPRSWLGEGKTLSFGPGLTPYGKLTVEIAVLAGVVTVEWQGQWHDQAPDIEVAFPGLPPVCAQPSQTSAQVNLEAKG